METFANLIGIAQNKPKKHDRGPYYSKILGLNILLPG